MNTERRVAERRSTTAQAVETFLAQAELVDALRSTLGILRRIMADLDPDDTATVQEATDTLNKHRAP